MACAATNVTREVNVTRTDSESCPDATGLAELTATQLSEGFRTRRLSPVEVVSSVLDRIVAEQPRINALVTVLDHSARTEARESEKRWHEGRPKSPLDGVPFTIKDALDLAGSATRRGSRTTNTDPATAESPAVQAMLAAGCIAVGKTAMAEFGWTATTDTVLHGITRNPIDTTRTAGGSSGGSAAAVAANLGPISLGTDGGGSVRIPAAFCGVVGFKPTQGRVPLWPPTPYGALAHVGTFTQDVPDAAAVFEVLTAFEYSAGVDRFIGWNSHARELPVRSVKEMRVGVIERNSSGATEDVTRSIAESADYFQAMGADVTDVGPVWDQDEVEAAFLVLWRSGLAGIHASMSAADTELLDPSMAAVAREGMQITGAQYANALSVCARLRERMHRIHQRFDILLSATTPQPAPRVGEQSDPHGPALTWPKWSPMTYPLNMTGQPAISVPGGTSREGLPIGIQIFGDLHQDALVLESAQQLEKYRAMDPRA
ncbi:amidase family protein [Mycobacterium sp. 21AC1]|uniref:amidase family protein n=1 Tax=[Mycobacterium] appelbergii TaxID=2939269 RepID=UPI002938CFCD|nr:amidase family protein [Mycobacterium sp. 21AC1]MDV3128431.1 amidase family protein [Mycobacterium sp. 21AC1]